MCRGYDVAAIVISRRDRTRWIELSRCFQACTEMQALDFIELAYRPTPSAEEWMGELLQSLPWTATSAAVFAYELDLSDLRQPRVGRHVSLRGQYNENEIVEGHRFLMGGADIWRLYRRRLTSARASFGEEHPVLQQFMAQRG